jgi:hypothetical protein
MIIRVNRKDRFLTEPERYCIVGVAPIKKVGCGEPSVRLQKVGSVGISLAKGSFEPTCGELQLYPRQDRIYKCCE